jgi:hypothetical protein
MTAVRAFACDTVRRKFRFEWDEVVRKSNDGYFGVFKIRSAVSTVQDPTRHFYTKTDRMPVGS